jgi:penicillin-binding protein 1A
MNNPNIQTTPNQNTEQLSAQVKKPSKLRPWIWVGVGLGLGLTGGAIAFAIGWQKLEKSLPESVSVVTTYAREGTITIQGSDGDVLQEIGPITHEKLKIWEIPDQVKEAFIASEDRRFYEHTGVDLRGVARAAYNNLTSQNIVEGGSSITQQLARIVFLDQERTLERKLKEMRLAQKIEREFSKEEILERYLNLVYLGEGAYGVADAAWIYFSKPLEALSLGEIATIASLAPAPSDFSPVKNLEAAQERRNLVLDRMVDQGFITTSEAETAKAETLALKPSTPKRLNRKYPYFTDYIQKEIPKYVSPEQIKQGGLVVQTTIDPQWQELAEETIVKAIERYGRGQRFKQGALVVIDPRNGQIKAIVGGKEFFNEEENGQFNRATQAPRQPGSTFKTFVYATAIAAGFSPNRGFLDAEYVVDGYRPKNYGDTYRNTYISMRNALIASTNVVAVRTLVDVGWNPIINIAKKMGIESELKPTYSLALGASEVNLLELTSAYGTLANQGIHQKAHGISRILDREGNTIYEADFSGETALDRDTAAIMTWMLQGVVTGGTGSGAQIGRPVAGKTGTSDQSRDLWFIGYIPQVVTGVWFGNDDNSPTYGASSTSAAVWRMFMKEAVVDLPIEQFPKLPQVEGRKATIEIEPIKPKRSYYQRQKTTQVDGNTDQPTRANQRRSTSSQVRRTQPAQTSRSTQPKPSTQRQTAPQQAAPAPAKAPAPVVAPKMPPAISKPSKSVAAPQAAPPAPPAPSKPVAAPQAAPPAPPAARKEE